jgi:hypothetical protein
MSSTNSLLRKPAWPEELGSVMAADLSEVLFDAWTQASLFGKIAAPQIYWMKLGELAANWVSYVSDRRVDEDKRV